MSGSKCRNCGSTNIETDPARGDAVCTECGFVLEDQLIVSETAFKETPSGNMMVLGQFVASDSTGGATGFGATYHVNGKESRGITLQNARKGITHLCMQLRLNQHCIDTSMNFYKMALNRQLTRGRKQAHNHAACVYITCRTEGTAHMLIDISDVLQICVHELGRTYLRFTQALCINIPSVDPCLYIMRFANKLEFGEKTHEVSMTALRVVQRMKRDSIHSGRRPSGLCGAALLMAARLHEFNRSPADIIKVVKVHESTLRKRLIEFGDTPSSALTLEEFMTVDLEEEQDPPAFKTARKKDRERLQRLENIETEINELQAEIDKQLEEHRSGKTRKRKDAACIEREDSERFVRESNLDVIKNYVENDIDDPDSEIQDSELNNVNTQLITGLGPNFASMGLIPTNDRENETKESTNFENNSGEIIVADLDDEELDSYIMSEKEAQFKHNLWNKVNAEYLIQQKEKEERRQKEKEEGKPEKKRRRTTKRNKSQAPANTAGEAIEKMLQEKKISSKINYEVLKSLNVGVSTPIKEQQKVEEPVQSLKTEADSVASTSKVLSGASPSKIQGKSITQTVKKPRLAKPLVQQAKKKELETPVEVEVNTVEPTLPREDICDIDETDDYIDEEVEADPTEMTVGQMLERNASEDENDFGYGYDEEDY
ncbi:Transcription factor IIIB 90 kDa subunit [Anthophora plagiata]